MKKNNKKGFTLAELLIVVAIIAVLTAIAIPIFTAQLEKSREETDIANMRAAKAAAVAFFLDNGEEKTVYFNASTGAVQLGTDGIAAYGKGTTMQGNSEAYPDYDKSKSYSGGYIKVTRGGDTGAETVNVEWVGISGS